MTTKLKTIDNYVGNPRLVMAPMFLLLPVIRDISHPPSQNQKNKNKKQNKQTKFDEL